MISYILNVSLRAEYSKSFFYKCICQQIALPLDNLHLQFVASANMLRTSITPLDMILSKAENKMLVIIRTTEIMKLLLSFVKQECNFYDHLELFTGISSRFVY